MFEAGSNLRARYYRLIPSDGYYTKDAIYVSSSFAERCQMSAQSLLAGFMPPLETLNPLPIRWQPIPVNSLPKERDNVMPFESYCRIELIQLISLGRAVFSSSPKRCRAPSTTTFLEKCSRTHRKICANSMKNMRNCMRI